MTCHPEQERVERKRNECEPKDLVLFGSARCFYSPSPLTQLRLAQNDRREIIPLPQSLGSAADL